MRLIVYCVCSLLPRFVLKTFLNSIQFLSAVADQRPVKNQTQIEKTTTPSEQPDSGFIALVVIASLSGLAVLLSVVSWEWQNRVKLGEN